MNSLPRALGVLRGAAGGAWGCAGSSTGSAGGGCLASFCSCTHFKPRRAFSLPGSRARTFRRWLSVSSRVGATPASHSHACTLPSSRSTTRLRRERARSRCPARAAAMPARSSSSTLGAGELSELDGESLCMALSRSRNRRAQYTTLSGIRPRRGPTSTVPSTSPSSRLGCATTFRARTSEGSRGGR